jgi:hypothetical protein
MAKVRYAGSPLSYIGDLRHVIINKPKVFLSQTYIILAMQLLIKLRFSSLRHRGS